MLDDDELKRRLEAARILRGLTQAELAALLAEDGLGLHDLGRIERGNKPMQKVHREAVARRLRIPEWWLTVEDTDVIVGLKPPPRLTPEETRDLLGRLLMDLDQDEAQEP